MVYVPIALFGMLFGSALDLFRSTLDVTYYRIYFLAKMVFLFVSMILAYALGYHSLTLLDGDKPVTDSFTCLYFSIVTWTTVGYGDVRPSLAARPLAAMEALVGYLSMPIIIGLSAVFFRHILSRRNTSNPSG
jgi:voltage-gated potassium channel Kch